MVQVQVQGLKELKQVLDRLPSHLQKNALSAANRAGAQVIRKEAISQLSALGIADAESKVVIRKSKFSTEESPSVLVGNSKTSYELGILERGSPGHVIEPVKKTVERQKAEFAAGKRKRVTKRTGTGSPILADSGTNTFFGTSVNHPGFNARPWLRSSADTKRDDVLKVTAENLMKGVDREIKRLTGKFKPRRRK